MTDRYLTVEDNLYAKFLDCLVNENNHANRQQGIATMLAEEMHAYADLNQHSPLTTPALSPRLSLSCGAPRASKTFPGTVDDSYRDAVDWAYSEDMIGANAQPDRTCVRIAATQLIWEAFCSPRASTNSSFSDVPFTDRYAKSVTWAVANGITTGAGDGKFSPDTSCTRGHIITFLYRAYA